MNPTQPTTDGAQRSSTWPFLNHPGKPETPLPPAQKQTRQKPDMSGFEDALI